MTNELLNPDFQKEVNSSLHLVGRQPSADTWQGLELVCQLVPRVGREDGVLRRLRRQQDQAQRRGGANSDRHLRRETSRQVCQESSSEGSFNHNGSCSSHCRPWWNLVRNYLWIPLAVDVAQLIGFLLLA